MGLRVGDSVDVTLKDRQLILQAVEVSTAGLRKPVGEIYPARPFLEMCVEAGRPVALSSDAHTPNDLAFRYDDALELLDAVGIDALAVFDRRSRRLEPIG